VFRRVGFGLPRVPLEHLFSIYEMPGPGASRDFDASKHISKKSWRRRYDSLRLAAEEARQATVAAVAATADALSANLAQMQFLEDARNTLRQLKGRKPGDTQPDK